VAHSKVFLLGIDGLPPRPFYRFVREGRLPHFARLLERAAVLDVISTLPPLTCPAWLAIASGASPGTIGVGNILLPVPGHSPDTIQNGFSSTHSKAEYVWETLDRNGMKAIVVKYPGSWPPRDGKFIQVDGAGGYADISCAFQSLDSLSYIAGETDKFAIDSGSDLFPFGYKENWRIDTGAQDGCAKIIVRDPKGWSGLPLGAVAVFESMLHIQPLGRQAKEVVYLLAYRAEEKAFVVLSRNKDASQGVHLTPGSWSQWLEGEGPAGAYAYRYKLIGLNLEERRLRLYRSEGHNLRGFTRPASLADELLGKVGPVVEWTGTYDLMNGLIDFDTQLELYEQHTAWLIQVIEHLTKAGDWHGFFTQWHVIEYAHHIVGASLHPDHPLHDPASAAHALDFLRSTYEIADRLLAAVEKVIDEKTLLVVASDHGHDLLHSIFYANHFLRRNGWLSVTHHNGKQVIDWSRSVAYALFPGCIVFNVAGRWPGGILPESKVEELALEITEALRGLVDPRTGRHVVTMVLNREELAAYGQFDSRAPDLMFCLDRGYETATRISEGAAGNIEFQVTVPYKEATSGHGSFSPASQSARTLALFAGPRVLPGVRAAPISVMDLAPTITSYLDMPPPRNSEGRAVNLSN
jgi:predicted AlkP superfamily phosphohydrolase/phosphomutase